MAGQRVTLYYITETEWPFDKEPPRCVAVECIETASMYRAVKPGGVPAWRWRDTLKKSTGHDRPVNLTPESAWTDYLRRQRTRVVDLRDEIKVARANIVTAREAIAALAHKRKG